jgi:glucose-6-phosphate 1-dehydrogenase
MRALPEPPPTILVIFGVTGDLSDRYLLPALYQIGAEGQLPKKFKVYGVSRRTLDTKQLLANLKNSHSQKAIRQLKDQFEIYRLDMAVRAEYARLKEQLNRDIKAMGPTTQVIFHLAIPPQAVLEVVEHLGRSGLNQKHIKLLMEKPFGTDLASARHLINQIDKYFSEDQVYRIDHYLAKGMAKNISVFISGNALFRDVWDRRFIDRIEIVAAEKIGIEGRIDFYEQTGALRDFLQSHLLQLAALVLMHPCPDPLDFADMPSRRLAALQALQPIAKNLYSRRVVRGQYIGYRDEVGRPDSTTETFVSLTFNSNDDRWQGVPITLTTGKHLDRRYSAIEVYFKKIKRSQTNKLTLRVQPDAGIDLELWSRQPGYSFDLEKVNLSFAFGQFYAHLPEPYEQILIDVFRRNRSLFPSGDEVLAAWRVLEPLQKYWQNNTNDIIFYKPGSSVEDVLKAR